jgi:hypothetical protein
LTILGEDPAGDPQAFGRGLLLDLDREGDYVFRFRIDPPPSYGADALRQFYRESILDLLKVVRFYAGGAPVVVDAFAFLNRPDAPIPLDEPADPMERPSAERGAPPDAALPQDPNGPSA